MQLPHDSVELQLRERCIQEVREHMPFVRCYVLPMTGVGPLPLKSMAHIPPMRWHEDVTPLTYNVVNGSHKGRFVSEGFQFPG